MWVLFFFFFQVLAIMFTRILVYSDFYCMLHYCIKNDCLYSLSDLDTLFKEIKCIFCSIQEISHYLKNLLEFKRFTSVKPPPPSPSNRKGPLLNYKLDKHGRCV